MMPLTEAQIEATVDARIRQFQTTPIRYFPYSSPVQPDLYRQAVKAYGSPVVIVGRAIHRPTPKVVTVIGDGEIYDIAFLFSRTEMALKFPTAAEGEWLGAYGEMEWRNRRYKIEQVRPTGQVGLNFAMLVVLANSIPGHRDAS